MTRRILITFALVLAAGLAFASGATDQEAAAAAEVNLDYLNFEGTPPFVMPIAKEPVTVSFAIPKGPTNGPWEELWFWQWLEEQANIVPDVEQIDSGGWAEKRSIMFASNTLPDVIMQGGFTASDIMRFGQIEQQLMPLNRFIDHELIAPNMQAVFARVPRARAEITNPDGNIYGLPTVIDFPDTSQRFYINQKWLDELDLSYPETLDDLYDLMKAFAARGPDIIPFTASFKSFKPGTPVLNAIGLPAASVGDLVVKDGRVLIPAAEPIVIEYYRYMNKLYAEGLLDRDIFTQDITATRAKSALHTVGLITEWAPALIAGGGTWEEWRILLPLTSEFNDSRTWTGPPAVSLAGVVLSANANYPEAVIRLFDMSFTDAGRVLFRQGPGRDFHPEFITGKGGWWVEDLFMQYPFTSEAPNIPSYINRYITPGYKGLVGARQSIVGEWAGVPLTELPRGKAFRDEMDEIRAFLVPPYPNVYLQEERLNRAIELQTPIEDYIATMEAKFIVGDESLDDFDRYLDQLKALGVEEYIEIYQETYDGFSANLN